MFIGGQVRLPRPPRIPSRARVYGVPTFGLLSTLAAGVSAGAWLEITASSNIQAITDTAGPSATADAWTDSDTSIVKTMFDWGGKATWDSARGKLIYVGNGAGYSGANGTHTKVLTLDAATLQFGATWNPVASTIGHFYDSNPSLIRNGNLYRRAYQDENVYRMAAATGAWTSMGQLTGMGMGGMVPAMDVHPGLGASGSLLFCAYSGRLARWNLADDALTLIATSHSGVATSDTVCSYHPGIAAVVFGGGLVADGGATLHKIDAAGSVSTVSTTVPTGVLGIGPCNGTEVTVLLPDPQGRAFAWLLDPTTTRKVWRLDLAAGTWADHGAIPTSFGEDTNGDWTVGTTVPEVGVQVWVDASAPSGGSSLSKLWIFRPA